MKKLSTLFFFIVSFSTTAQLTNQQVYDFQAGDVFQVTYGAGSLGPHPIITDTIISKSFSTGMDSITYLIKRLDYLADNLQGTPASYNYSIDTLIITNLNAPAVHFNYTSCLPPSDTTFFDSCNNQISRKVSNSDANCFEPPSWYSDLYLGLGGPYYYRLDVSISGSSNDWISKTLTYYNSSTYGECGIMKTFTSISENSLKTIRFYPNPAQNEITVELKNKGVFEYSILNLSGKIVHPSTPLRITGSTINISNLPNGYYIVQIIQNGRRFSSPLLISK